MTPGVAPATAVNRATASGGAASGMVGAQSMGDPGAVRRSKLAEDLAPVLPLAGLDPAARGLIEGAATAAEALERLLAAGANDAALRLYAFALPRREAVWWACMCVTATAPADQNTVERAARGAAEHWVRRQDEETRRAAHVAAQQVGVRVPEYWAGFAAFWSGGSMAPPGQPVVPPQPHLTATAAHGAVMLAAVRQTPRRRAERMLLFLTSARDIAIGGAGQIALEVVHDIPGQLS